MPEKENKELYQRIEKLGRFLCGGVPEFAKALNVNQRTFYGYLSKDRQHKLWPLLPGILDEYPRVSRMWLYFGFGPMLIGHRVPLDLPVPQQMIAAAAEEIAADCGGTWQDILEYILACRNDQMQAASRGAAEAAHDGLCMADKNRIIDLQNQLIAAQNTIIQLQKAMNAKITDEQGKQELSPCAGRTAHTGQDVARS